MTNLDDLKDAMAAPPGFAPRPIDLAGIMAAGGRVRRRRRLAIGAASGLAVAALLVGGAQVVAQQATSDRGAPTAQVAEQPVDDAALGDIIGTGIAAEAGEWLLYATPIDESAIPETHFGIMAGRRLPSGTLSGDVLTNEVEGSDRAPGFHAVQASMTLDAGKSPTFGYYVGPATRITATMSGTGTSVTAHQTVWSEDPSVVIFWFSPDPGTVRRLKAYDSDGKQLPAGNSEAGVG